ncbi:phage T7 F exclusion suppressor FxsA [Botrimarina colliarenosi]|uniref:Phage T7 F exclusion suppressor FxsA n=1 Tax=Botrimarina colliarenosi TaxID=2528001 RepID=A0A5C6AKG5_9BACT|nr:FxsA family protein [Botrimarina colliarenosi]TWU00523.1 phage T7 F exclusion suppressor FxsA [Botrimarina colliarenosi]
MLLTLLLLFTLLPMAEIYLLVTLFQTIGWFPTLLIALSTGVIGASLARSQGLATLSRITQEMSAGKAPADALVDGAMILLAGALLVTPGVLTDAFGFALLIPPLRSVLKPLLRAAFRRNLQRRSGPGGAVYTWSAGNPPPERRADQVIDAEVIEVRTRDAE